MGECTPESPCHLNGCVFCDPTGYLDGAGSELLDEVRRKLTTYVVLPSPEVEVGVVLWIAATHAVDALNTATRLAIRSPEKRCGKTRLLDVVGALCRNALPTANVSAAVLYRVMGGERTLIIDEADTVWGTKRQAENNEDLRGLVNAGFERGRPTLRYDIKSRDVEELETFGFVALAGIGALPDTITDRAVNLTMRRRKAGESVKPFRSRRDGEPLLELRERLAAWVAGRLDYMKTAEPDLPVEDRAADVWEPLVIVADAAGGDWPRLARAAAVKLSTEHDEEDRDSTSLTLLTDIRAIFEKEGNFLQSKDLVFKLRAIDESPWGQAHEDLTAVKLALRLRDYKIKPVRNTTGTARGYKRDDFKDAFARYLEPSDDTVSRTIPSEPVNPSFPQVNPPTAQNRLTSQGVKVSSRQEPVGGLTRQYDDLTGLDDYPTDFDDYPTDSDF